MHYPMMPYNPYYPFVKYAQETQPGFWSTAWQASRPYLGAAGIGAGIGALGGLGAALVSRKDWKNALKSALVGAILGGVGGALVRGGYGLYQRWRAAPAPAATPESTVPPAAPVSETPATSAPPPPPSFPTPPAMQSFYDYQSGAQDRTRRRGLEMKRTFYIDRSSEPPGPPPRSYTPAPEYPVEPVLVPWETPEAEQMHMYGPEGGFTME